MRTMTNGFDLVVFDCDGVVVDSEVLACQALADTFDAHGLPLGIEGVIMHFLGRSFDQVESFHRDRTGKPLPETFRTDLRRRIEQVFRASLEPMSGIGSVLETLDRPYCLASSSDPDRIGFTLRAARLTDRFGERVYSASQVTRGKPAPDLFLFAAGAMGGTPTRCLVIEDTVPGVLAGKAAGMTVWGFTGGSHCIGRDTGRELKEAGADRVFDRMSAFFEG
jgi:HAD superfamily hydrolase (TIGR01509 family)